MCYQKHLTLPSNTTVSSLPGISFCIGNLKISISASELTDIEWATSYIIPSYRSQTTSIASNGPNAVTFE